MNRRGLLAVLLMPIGQQTWGEGRITLSGPTVSVLSSTWQVTLPDQLTVSTKDGWSKTFTHDELKRLLSEGEGL